MTSLVSSKIAEMVGTIENIKHKITTQEYIELYDSLMEINKTKPLLYDKKHRVDYQLVSCICFIENNGDFDSVKRDLFYDSYEQYSECDSEPCEDYERINEIVTSGSYEIFSSEYIEFNENDENINKLVSQSVRAPSHYHLSDGILEIHQREVQKYYSRYIRDWNDWVRIVNTSAVTITNVVKI
tara:strand:- start:36 stop:587 length:552 start_codon:yes stop_codon:yes gene_type:complete